MIRTCRHCKGIITLNGEHPYYSRGYPRKSYWCDHCLEWVITTNIRNWLKKQKGYPFSKAHSFELTPKEFTELSQSYEHYQPSLLLKGH